MITYAFVYKRNRLQLEQVVLFRAIQVLQSKTNAKNAVRELKIYIKNKYVYVKTGTKFWIISNITEYLLFLMCFIQANRI